MRFITSIVLLASSLVVLVLGIGQQTWLRPQPTVTDTLELSGSAPAVVIGGDVLSSHSGPVQITVTSSGNIAAGIAIQDDVNAWLGDGEADVFSLATGSTPQTRSEVGTSTDVPSAAGSDLWLEEFVGTDQLTFTTEVSAAESLIIAGGSGSIPSAVSLTWAQDTSAPLAIPLVIIGSIALIAGAIMLGFAIRHERRVVAPRRASRRASDPRRNKASSGRNRGRRSAEMTAVVASGLVLVLLSGCSNGAVSAASSSLESQSAAVNDGVSEDSPRLTSSQVEGIVSDISSVAATADANRDTNLIATRFAGAALQLRLSNYTARGADSSIAALAAIPDVTPTVFLPQLSSDWPRQAFVILDDETSSEPPTALMLVQNDARSNYVVRSDVQLISGVPFPSLPTAEVGGVALAADTSLLSVSPSEVGNAYADVIANGASSTYASLFSSTTDSFIDATKTHESTVTSDLGARGTVTFTRTQDSATPALSMSTADSGAIVAVYMLETETSKPNSGYELTLTGDAKALLGKSSTSKGVQETYGDMLLFSVPAAGTTSAGVTLLGFSSGLVKVEELP